MDEDTLPPQPAVRLSVERSNVRLRQPEVSSIPDRLQRELQRDLPRSRTQPETPLDQDRRRAQPRRWRVPAAVAGVLLLALGIWTLWPRPQFDGPARDQWVQLCQDYETWYAPFLERLTDDDLEMLRDQSLINAQANIGIYNFDPRYIAQARGTAYADLAADPPEAVRTDEGVAKTRAAAASITRLLEAFDAWPVHAALQEHLKVFADCGWDRATDHLRDVLKDAPPRGQATLSDALPRMIAVEARAAVIAANALQLGEDLAVLERVNDPVLQHFRGTVTALTEDRLPRGGTEAQHLQALGEALQPLAAFGERFRLTLESQGWKNLDYDGFRAEGEAYVLLQDPALDARRVYRQWLQEVRRYFAMDHDWRVAWARDARGRLDEILDHADALARAGRTDDAHLARQRAAALEARVQSVTEPMLTSRESERLTVDRYDIEGEIASLASAMQNLAVRTSVNEAVNAILDGEPLTQASHRSEVVDARWRAELLQLGDRLERNGDPNAMSRDAQDVRTRLYALIEPGGDRSLPPAPTFGQDRATDRSPESAALRQALIRHCQNAREAGFTELLRGPLPVDTRVWDRERASYLNTLRAAEGLHDLSQDIDRMFREVRLPDDPALRRGGQLLIQRIDQAQHPLLEDPELSGPAQAVLNRGRRAVVAHRGQATDDQTAGDVEPLVRLAAWAQLSEHAASGSRPASFAAAQERLRVAEQAAGQLEGIQDPERRAHWHDRLAKQQLVAWQRLAETAGDRQQIAAVLAAADRLAVPSEAMPPRMRFNARLTDLQTATAAAPDQDDAALLRQARAFARGAAAFRSDPDAGPWVDELIALTAETSSTTNHFESAGPARAGWTLVSLDQNQAATFALGNDRLRFVRIVGPDGPYYLAESELPVATALATARDLATGRELTALLGIPTGDDAHKGPRTWVYDPQAREQGRPTPLSVNPGSWRPGEDHADRPSPRSPLNYVSAEAAVYLAGLLGCRLPTEAEWNLAAEHGLQREVPPNLRDRAWGDHAAQIASRIQRGERDLAWADSDQMITTRRSDPLTAGTSDDGVVWLRPVPRADESTPAALADLRGNVAELITRAPVDPTALMDRGRGNIQTRIKAFRSAHKNAFAVAGGSALSVPTASPGIPQPYNLFTGSRGFADVGLRLAFSAPDFSPAQRVRLLLADPPILGAGRRAAP